MGVGATWWDENAWLVCGRIRGYFWWVGRVTRFEMRMWSPFRPALIVVRSADGACRSAVAAVYPAK
ncbi:hypothetical protein J2Z83_003648 [Virgibacillus natechei]|uniref:Uncharacterized protein n=1 Tax=Virgibacillus natechei TaxID=1216297 RepID=A0ABS4IKJ7_9BACI|nr:hypothetical protein [Virgibacillus natechei]